MRAFVRLITVLAGLVLAVFGVLLVVEVVALWLRPDLGGVLISWQGLRTQLSQMSWDSWPVRLAAIVLGVLGLVLLALATRAGRKEVRLHDPAPEVTVTTDPRSMARLVGHRVRELDGVGSAAITASRGRVQVRATSRFSHVGDLRSHVTETARDAVRSLPMSKAPKVSVSVSAAKERR